MPPGRSSSCATETARSWWPSGSSKEGQRCLACTELPPPGGPADVTPLHPMHGGTRLNPSRPPNHGSTLCFGPAPRDARAAQLLQATARPNRRLKVAIMQRRHAVRIVSRDSNLLDTRRSAHSAWVRTAGHEASGAGGAEPPQPAAPAHHPVQRGAPPAWRHAPGAAAGSDRTSPAKRAAINALLD